MKEVYEKPVLGLHPETIARLLAAVQSLGKYALV